MDENRERAPRPPHGYGSLHTTLTDLPTAPVVVVDQADPLVACSDQLWALLTSPGYRPRWPGGAEVIGDELRAGVLRRGVGRVAYRVTDTAPGWRLLERVDIGGWV